MRASYKHFKIAPPLLSLPGSVSGSIYLCIRSELQIFGKTSRIARSDGVFEEADPRLIRSSAATVQI